MPELETVLARIAAGETIVADGAMGSLLMAKGLRPGMCPESMNLSRPELLEDIARQYREAGADIVQTNTFGGSSLKLRGFRLEDRMEEINRNAVVAARKGATEGVYLSASCGPTGRLLKPYGDTDPEEIYESFRNQLEVVVEAGVDIICVETMIDLREAVLAVKAARSIAPSIPLIATMTFEATARGFFTVMGNRVEDAVRDLSEAGADILGSNCGNGSETMIRVAATFRSQTVLPLIIQANAGIPSMVGGEPVYPETPEFMAEKSLDLVREGVSIVGGCCGTTPAHIRSIAGVLKERRQGT